jgi:polysaccharide biosynthesis protein PslG
VGAERRTPTRWSARLAFAALLALSAIGLGAGSAQAVPKSFYGIVPQLPLDVADFDRMGQGNVGTLRVQLTWEAADPAPPVGDYSFYGFDPIVLNAARNGVRVLPFVFGTPPWVATGLDGRQCTTDCSIFAPKSRAARDAWSDFLRTAVARYGPNGTFWKFHPEVPQLPITAWQIWNEQNSPKFYAPKPKAKRYAKLLKASAKAIRSVDPSADIVLGGMAELSGVKKAIKGADFLRQLYKIKRAKKSFDGVAPHPYGARMKKVEKQIALVRKVLKRAKDKKAQMWITEIGWSSAEGKHPLKRGPAGQAKRLKQAFKYFKKRRGKLHVKNVDWFSWTDSPASICKWCEDAGLFAPFLVPKPSWTAFTKLTGGS